MAKILYGVMGNTYGHIMRTLAITSRMPEHDYRFIGGGRLVEAFKDRHPVLEMPVFRTVHHKHRISILRTACHIARCLGGFGLYMNRVFPVIDEFQPDLIVTDREYFTPIAAYFYGRPCISIDHSHIMKACYYAVPPEQRTSWFLAMLNDYLFFNFTRRNLIVSFFAPPLKAESLDEIFPPVLRPEVRNQTPSAGDYIFVYQSSSTFGQLVEALRKQPRPVIIYGVKKNLEVSGNLIFKPYNFVGLLKDMAGSAYVVANGGHNVLCEALYYGKPVLSFPISGHFEQFINAWHLRSLGYGDFSTSLEPAPRLFEDFEAGLPVFRQNLGNKNFDGTPLIVSRIQELIRKETERLAYYRQSRVV